MTQTGKSNLPPFNRETRAIEAPHVPGKLKTIQTEVVWLIGTSDELTINACDFDPTVHEHIVEEVPDPAGANSPPADDPSDVDPPADDSDADSSEKGEKEHDAQTTKPSAEGSQASAKKAGPKKRQTTGK